MAIQPEIWLTSLTKFSLAVTILKGGNHRALHMHVTNFDSDPFEMKDEIDKIMKNRESFLVIFSSMTKSKEEKLLKRSYRIRYSVVEIRLNHFKTINQNYMTGIYDEDIRMLNQLVIRNDYKSVYVFHSLTDAEKIDSNSEG